MTTGRKPNEYAGILSTIKTEQQGKKRNLTAEVAVNETAVYLNTDFSRSNSEREDPIALTVRSKCTLCIPPLRPE